MCVCEWPWPLEWAVSGDVSSFTSRRHTHGTHSERAGPLRREIVHDQSQTRLRLLSISLRSFHIYRRVRERKRRARWLKIFSSFFFFRVRLTLTYAVRRAHTTTTSETIQYKKTRTRSFYFFITKKNKRDSRWVEYRPPLFCPMRIFILFLFFFFLLMDYWNQHCLQCINSSIAQLPPQFLKKKKK